METTLFETEMQPQECGVDDSISAVRQADLLDWHFAPRPGGFGGFETWLVAYDSDGTHVSDGELTAVAWDRNTVWVSNKLRGKKVLRNKEIANAIENAGLDSAFNSLGLAGVDHLLPAEVIEAWYIFTGDKYLDTWLVAYDEWNVLDDEPLILTDIHWQPRVLWVKETLRGRKKRRDELLAVDIQGVAVGGYKDGKSPGVYMDEDVSTWDEMERLEFAAKLVLKQLMDDDESRPPGMTVPELEPMVSWGRSRFLWNLSEEDRSVAITLAVIWLRGLAPQ